jgi:hypothetical protein
MWSSMINRLAACRNSPGLMGGGAFAAMHWICSSGWVRYRSNRLSNRGTPRFFKASEESIDMLGLIRRQQGCRSCLALSAWS